MIEVGKNKKYIGLKGKVEVLGILGCLGFRRCLLYMVYLFLRYDIYGKMRLGFSRCLLYMVYLFSSHDIYEKMRQNETILSIRSRLGIGGFVLHKAQIDNQGNISHNVPVHSVYYFVDRCLIFVLTFVKKFEVRTCSSSLASIFC